jgi:hypothetical protein
MNAGDCKRGKNVLGGNVSQSSYAGLTRVSINLRKTISSKRMGCRVKPGNDKA